jgi:GH15 family glucan-1,4-alpha-glucosidase
LSCASGLRAVARRPRAQEQGSRWESLADTIVADTARAALHPTGRWQRSPADARIDSALLLPGIRGALAPGDPRTAATLRAVLNDLTEDGYAYRFRHGDEPLHRAEGAFLLCGFLVSLSLLDEGDIVGAARWFERNRSACGPPGLFTEEFDVAQRQLRGNLPQAFVHALLIECAQRLGDVA